MSCAIWRWLECGENVKVGSGHAFVVLWAHVRVSTPLNGCHSAAHFAWTPMMIILIKVKYVLMFMWEWTLCSHHAIAFLTFGDSLVFREFFAYMWLEIGDDLHTPNARWLAYSGLRILAWEFVEMLNSWVVPICGSHTHTRGGAPFIKT